MPREQVTKCVHHVDLSACVQAGSGSVYGDEDCRSGLDNIHDTVSTATMHGHGVRLPEGMTEDMAVAIYDNYNLQHLSLIHI